MEQNNKNLEDLQQLLIQFASEREMTPDDFISLAGAAVMNICIWCAALGGCDIRETLDDYLEAQRAAADVYCFEFDAAKAVKMS